MIAYEYTFFCSTPYENIKIENFHRLYRYETLNLLLHKNYLSDLLEIYSAYSADQ